MGSIDSRELYGLCSRCGRYRPKGDLRSVHTSVWDEDDNRTVIRHRVCSSCLPDLIRELRDGEWDGKHLFGAEILTDAELAERAGADMVVSDEMLELARELRRDDDRRMRRVAPRR